ncbi:hypothetical protein CVT26_012319 [Gymnopilus dilepis]|uniref:F-box domain-containing protein n=1 Tax=Gymnopilus dilepis TaxID=231916 RepID=A0A409YCD7_9AGAR|nr:hypothetical protein CVT26_012319 [Gymnopilus dilepis]
MNSNGPQKDIRSISQAELKIIDDKLQVYEADVSALEAALKGLHGKRYDLYEERNRALPISKLPLEILTQIFFLTCQSSQNPGQQKLPGPFLIGRICRSWRRIAWFTPKFWTEISLSLSATRYHTQVELVREWIERTAECRLHLDIDRYLGEGEGSVEWEPPEEIFDILLESCKRWESLRFVAFGNFFKAVDRKPHAQFASLKKLIVRRHPMQRPESWACRPWFLMLNNQIEQLAFERGISRRNLVINWSCLQNLRASLTLHDWFEVLKQCETLKGCDLMVRGVTSVGMPAIPPIKIVLPHLTSFKLCGFDQTFPFLLQSLELPNLTMLQFSIWRTTRADACWVTALIEIARRCCFPLQDLTIVQTDKQSGCPKVPEEDICNLLDVIPTLEHLRLELPEPFSLSDTTLLQLAVKAEILDGRMLTLGNFLDLKNVEYKGQISFTLDKLLDMLTSRAALVHISSIRGEASSSAAKDKGKFHMQINYTNQDWYRQKNPNDLPQFYNHLVSMSALVRLDLCYM